MTQQNSQCMLCSDRNETVNHVINECSKLVQKNYKTRHDWVGKVKPLGIVQEIEIWPNEEVEYAQPGIRIGEWTEQTFLGFWDINRSPNLGETSRPVIVGKKNETSEWWTLSSWQTTE